MDNTNFIGLILFLWIVGAPTVGFALIGRGGGLAVRPIVRGRDVSASDTRTNTDVIAERRELERERRPRTG